MKYYTLDDYYRDKKKKYKKEAEDFVSNDDDGKIYSYDDYQNDKKKALNQDYDISQWFKSASNVINAVNDGSAKDYNFVAKTPAYSKKIDNLLNEDRAASSYIESLRGTDSYDEIKSSYDEYKNNLKNLSDYTRNLGNFASQYNNEEDFNLALKNVERSQKYGALKTVDDYKRAMEETDDEDDKLWLSTRAQDIATSADVNDQLKRLQEIYANPNAQEDTAEVREALAVPEENREELINKYKALAGRKERQENLDKYFYSLSDDEKNIIKQYNDMLAEDVPTADDSYSGRAMLGAENQKIINAAESVAKNKGVKLDDLSKWYSRGIEDLQAKVINKKAEKAAKENPAFESYKTVIEHPFRAIGTAGQYLKTGIDEMVTGEEGYINPEATLEYAVTNTRNTVSKDINNPIGSFLYNTGMSFADFASLLPLNAVPGGQALSLSIMSTEAGTQSANEVLENGGSFDSALATGVASGIAEAVFEKLSLEQLSAFRNAGKASTKAMIKDILKGSFVEGSEEVFTDIANLITDNVINGDFSQVNENKKNYIRQGYTEDEADAAAKKDFAIQLGESFAGGALSGGIMNAGIAGVKSVGNTLTGSDIKAQGNEQQLLDIADMYYSDNKDVTKYADKLKKQGEKGKEYSSSKLGMLRSELLDASSKARTSQRSTIRNQRIENSDLSESEKTIAKKFVNGDKLSKNDVNIINSNNALQRIVSAAPGADSFVHSDNFLKALQSTDIKLPKLNIVEYKNTDTSGMSNQQALEAQAEAQGFNSATTEKFINNYDDSMSVDNYTREFLQYHNLGRNLSPRNALDESSYSLNDRARIAAYESGKDVFVAHAQAENKLTQLQEEWKKEHRGYTEGTVDTSEIEGINLKTNQQASVDYISEFAKHGLNIKVYASKPDSSGRYTAPNGYYDSYTNTVHIDINAGKTRINEALKNGAMLSTMSHELTHVAEHAAAEYADLREAIVNAVGAEKWEGAVSKEVEKIRHNHPEQYESLTNEELRETASREAIAEYCSDMLRDSKVMEKMIEENPSFAQKVINIIKNAIKRLHELYKRAFKDYNISKENVEILKNTIDDYQALVDKWDKAVMEGIKHQNARAAVKDNTEQSGNVQNEDRNNPYGITEKDIKNIQNIGRKSIFKFKSKEISLTEPWAREFWKSIGTKSPFFRAWFGDWRANDNTKVEVATKEGIQRGIVKNTDTGWKINVSSKVFSETNNHKQSINKRARKYLPYINDIISKAILLDTFVSDKDDTPASLFMHSFYAVADIGNGAELLKLYVEELYNPNSPNDINRVYQLQNIEKSSVSAKSSHINASSVDLTDDIHTVSDLYRSVKQHDKHFNPTSPSKVVDDDGKPLVVYHGSDADFTIFDKTKGRSGMDIQGMFFSPWELDAKAYGSNVRAFYLNIKNPAPEGIAYKVLNKYAGENYAGIKAREELERMGYDGVNNGDEEYIAFYPEQIKSATDNIGSYDKNNPDFRYQDRDYLSVVESGDMKTAQKMVDEAAKAAGYNLHLYHGSKNGGGFTVFKGWQYFTDKKEYAERYTQRDTGNGLYEVFVNANRIFDTRKPTDRKIFEQYRNEYGLSELSDSGLPDWTDGYDLSEIIEDNGLDYDGIILDEGGDLVNGKPVSRGLSYVIRNSNQVKSADPVTYDDNDNVIPLSERFNEDNRDIRYQDREKLTTEDDLITRAGDFDILYSDDEDLFEDENEENVDFEKMVEEYPSLAMEMVFNKLSEQSHEIVRIGRNTKLPDTVYKRIANKIVKDYSIERDHLEELTEKVKTFIESASDENFSDDFKKFVIDMRHSLLYSNTLDEVRDEMRKDVRDTIKGRTLIIPKSAESEIRSSYESIKNYARRLFGYGVTVALEENMGRWDKRKAGYCDINTFIVDIQICTGQLMNIEAEDGEEAYKFLEEYLRNALSPQYHNPYLEGIRENIDIAAVEVASDVITEYTHQLGLDAARNNKNNVRDLTRRLEKAQEQRDKLLKASKENAKLNNELKSYKERLETLQADTEKLDEVNWLIKSNYEDDTLLTQREELEKKVDEDSDALLRLKSTKPIKRVLERQVKRAVNAERAKQRKIISENRNRYTEEIKELKDKNKSKLSEWREARNLSDVVDSIGALQRKMAKALRNPTENVYVPDAFATVYIEACSAITDALNTGKVTMANIKLLSLKNELERLNNSDTEYNGEVSEQLFNDLGYIIDLTKVLGQQLENLEGRPITKKTISLKEATDIYNVLFEIYHTVQDATKQLGRQDKITNYESGMQIDTDMKAVKSFADKTKASKLKKEFLNAIRTARYYSGYNNNSEIMYHVNALNEGVRKANIYKMNAEKEFLKLTEENKKDYKRSLNEIVDIKYQLNNGEEAHIKMTRMMALQTLMTWTREQKSHNLVHMERSGIVVPDAELYVKGKIGQAYSNSTRIAGINTQFITALEGSLTDFEQRYRKIAENYFNHYAKKAINEVSNVIKHRSIAMADYYIPISVDKNYLVNELEELKYDSTLEGMGMLKSTVPRSNLPIIITSLNEVVARHINDTSKLYGLAIPARNFKKALNVSFTDINENGDKVKSGSVRDTIKEVWNEDANKFFNRLIADLESNRNNNNNASNFINKSISGLRKAMVIKTLTANISVVIKQAASYPTAGLYLSHSSLTKALAAAPALFKPGNYQKLLNEIDEHTAQHYMRRLGMSTPELHEFLNSWANKTFDKLPGKLSTVANPGKWIQGVDCFTTALLWNAAKNEVNKTGLTKNSEGYWTKVTELYDKVIEDTQPMYDSLHRSELQKTTNEVWKSIFMFKTQPLQNTGIIYDSIGNALAHSDSKEARNTAIKAVSSQIISLGVFAGMSFLAAMALHKRNRYKDENDEITLMSILSTIINDMFGNGVGVAMPVFGNEIYEAAKAGITKNGRYDTFSMPLVDMLNDTVSSTWSAYDEIVRAVNMIQNGLPANADSVFSSFSDLGVQISGLFGIPTQNLMNIFNGAKSHFQDFANGTSYFESEGGRKPIEYAKSYGAAYTAGDSEKAKAQLDELYQSKYEEEIAKGNNTSEAYKKAHTSVRKALTNAYKLEYQKAFIKNDENRMQEISSLLSDSGYMVYSTNRYLSQVLSEWREKAQEDVIESFKK